MKLNLSPGRLLLPESVLAHLCRLHKICVYTNDMGEDVEVEDGYSISLSALRSSFESNTEISITGGVNNTILFLDVNLLAQDFSNLTNLTLKNIMQGSKDAPDQSIIIKQGKLPNLHDLYVGFCKGVVLVDVSDVLSLCCASVTRMQDLTKILTNKVGFLATLKCISNKKLAHVDFSKTICLSSLELTNNQALLSADISGCESLSNLTCGLNSSLENLDVSGCILLDTVLVRACIDEVFQSILCVPMITCLCLEKMELFDVQSQIQSMCHLKQLALKQISAQCLSLFDHPCLESLLLDNNHGLGVVDVSGCRRLLKLVVSNHGTLVSLDVHGCIELGVLMVMHVESLHSLNISGCQHIMLLTLSGIPLLDDLDVSIQPHLKYVKFKKLRSVQSVDLGSSLDLTTADFSQLPCVKCVSLMAYQCIVICCKNNLHAFDKCSVKEKVVVW